LPWLASHCDPLDLSLPSRSTGISHQLSTFFFFFQYWGLISVLKLHSCYVSATWGTPPTLFGVLGIFEIGFHDLFAQLEVHSVSWKPAWAA
jgi:hypothetical protein